jgi:hypothetical protein
MVYGPLPSVLGSLDHCLLRAKLFGHGALQTLSRSQCFSSSTTPHPPAVHITEFQQKHPLAEVPG